MAQKHGFNPIASALTFVTKCMARKVQFVQESVGKTVSLPDGHQAQIFRHLRFDEPRFISPATLLHVRFKLKGLSAESNKRFSVLPIPFFAGLKGFRGKCWCYDEATGEFHGFYAWQARDHAEEYTNSYAMRFMRQLAAPGSIHHEIRMLFDNPFGIQPQKKTPVG